jgi:hypothetical protein
MSRLPKLALLLTTLILLSLSLLSPTVSAVTKIIGSSNDLTRYPFGKDPGAASGAFPDFAAGGTYQQVYSGSAFSGPVTITQIAFSSKSQLTSGPGTATYNFNLSLSTTAAGPGALSTNLAANRGANFTQVFAGTRTATITANDQFDLVIDITPFTYDPANGNLLIDVNFNAPTQFTGGAVLYFNAGFNASASRAANPSGIQGGAFTDGFSIQTRFTTKSNAQVTLSNLAQTFDGNPKSVAVTTTPPGLGVVVTYDGSVTPPTNAGSYAVVATLNDPDFIGQASGNLIIGKADQQIAFDPLPNKTLADPDFIVIATASSNLPVSLAASGPCTLNGAQVHLTGEGACTITASQDGNANINAAAPVARTFSIGKADQQITFDALPDKTFGDPDFNVGATASSNLGVSFAADGNCTLNGAEVHLTGAGPCTITASQEGNSNFNPATAIARTFTISKADQQLTFDALADKKFGDADFGVDATASSNLAVAFSASGNCTVSGTQVHITGAGSCAITASQEGNSNYNPAPVVERTFSIGKGDQQITFDALADKKFGDPDFGLNATVSSNLTVNLLASGECTLTGTQIHITGAGSCTVTASQDGDANVSAAVPVARTFSIGKSEQQIIFEALADGKFGDADFGVNATSSSNLAVSLSASGNCTLNGTQVSLTGAGSCTIEATQPGDANYNAAAPVSRSFAINKAAAVVTLGSLAQVFDGTPKSATAATNPAGLNVTLTYSQGGAPVASPTNAGSYDVTATINDANHEGSNSGTLVIGKATPVITWQPPQDIIYGTALSATQLNASANVAGTFTYTPAAGVVLHAGANQPLQVNFAPENANDYETVSKGVTLNVLRAGLTVRADDRTRTFGSPNPQFTFAITGFVNNDTQAGATTGQPSLNTAATPGSDAGNYPITASLGTLSSNDYSFSFVDGTLTVTKADQAIAFGALANKIYGDAPFAVIATGGANGNAITFSSQTPAVCSVTGDTVSILAVGTCTIRASQSASPNNNAATDVDQSFDVARALTTTRLASSINPSGLGEAVTFTATVTSAAGTPTGTVQFIIDGVNQGKPRSLNALGVASGSTSVLTAGNHKVTAEYTGDANFASSNGALAVDQTVNVVTSISISDASLTEGDAGTKSIDFTVRLSTQSNVAVQVDFATANGTATAGADYQSTTGTLTFAPGDVSETVTVLINGNTKAETNKTFFVNLTNPQNAAIDIAQGLGTILNDDSPGVQFSRDSDSFSEGAGHGDIIVTRTGDISQPLTVDYQTLDRSALTPCQTNNTGNASDRCDYETAAGTLQFAAGEAQKTIPLVLINDAYVEPVEQLSIRLSNPNGATLGAFDTATVSITDDDAQLATQNPIDDLDFFIRQLYIDFLGREPEPAGLAFWKARMTTDCPAGQTCDRVDTALKFFGSDEFRERGYFIYLFYHAALGRRPTYSEWIMDVSKLNGPKTVPEQEAARAAFIQEFMSRQEFMNLYNGAQAGQTFVDALIEKSVVIPGSRQQLIDNYQAVGRGGTLKAFLETPEVQDAFRDRAFVTMLYSGFLRRDAETGGFDFWMQKLNETNHDDRFLLGGFLQSDEYHFRFALLPLAQ